MNTKVSIIGTGIIGLAHALAFAKKGMDVSVFERHAHPLGASIRNFGLFWSIGQEQTRLPIVNRSRTIWMDLLKQINMPFVDHGALLLAYSKEEFELLKSFAENESAFRSDIQLLHPKEILKSNLLVNTNGLVGGLKTNSEFSVNPRIVLPKIISFLQSEYGVAFSFNTPIQFASDTYLASEYQTWESDIIVICSGDDFETLYPEEIRASCLEKCHLQMLKIRTRNMIQLGSTYCSALSFLHYPSFSDYPEIDAVRKKIRSEYPEYLEEGINVLITQNSNGDIIIGDSHLYEDQPQPFNIESTNQLILNYLKKFIELPPYDIVERWTGSYSVHPEHKHLFTNVDENIWISTAFGEAGMTMGFGQAEENVKTILNNYQKHEKFQHYPVAF